MLRTVYTPNSNLISLPIPDRYIGTELEIIVFPIHEVSASNPNIKTAEVDLSFGGWAEMNNATEDICSKIKENRSFRNRDIRAGWAEAARKMHECGDDQLLIDDVFEDEVFEP